ncbi:MAG: hypothetical protein FJ387_13365 [Verrucomicrobia bacterium]|nr:hypothetical protein [Verrucomicrobiota bacterium]
MSAMESWSDPLFDWLWRASWQAGVLVLIVLLVQRLFRQQLAPAWRHALWMVVVARLCLPLAPSSAFSIFGLMPPEARAFSPAQIQRSSLPGAIESVPREPAGPVVPGEAAETLVAPWMSRMDAPSYGKTIIKVLENFNRPGPATSLVGILEDAQQLKQRLRWIAAFRRPTRWPVLALALIAGMGAIGLTDPQKKG